MSTPGSNLQWPHAEYLSKRLHQKACKEAALFDMALSRPGDVLLYDDYAWVFGLGRTQKDKDRTRALLWEAGKVAKARFGVFLRNIPGVGYKVTDYDEHAEIVERTIQKGCLYYQRRNARCRVHPA